MPVPRRLTALAATLCVLAATLVVGVLGVTAPAAQAALAPHDPATYYAGTEGLSGAALAARLHTIIKGNTKLTYAQVYDDLPLTDADPDRPGYLVDFYSGTPVLASDRCGSSCPIGSWNREHTWPQSHGDFGTTAGIGTDLFHMRPEFGNTNSSRGNLDYDDTPPGNAVPNCADCHRDSDSFEPRAAIKGDAARGLLYMAVRYEADDSLDMKMNDQTCNGSGAPNMGKLSTLVAWSLADPPDARERARNDLIDSDYQHNRNPFIDHPEWVTSIFGNGVGLGPACGGTTGSDYVPGGTTAADQPPTTSPMSATTAEDTATSVTLVATDPDGDPLTWSTGQAPAHGTATVSGSTLAYTPARDFNGDDTLGVIVSDGRGGTASTTLRITVTPVDDAPVASGVSAGTVEGSPVTFTLRADDADGDTLTYAVATPPAHGAVGLRDDRATYTPATGYDGADSFTFVAYDASSASAPATASITVTAGNPDDLAPTAVDLSATTDRDGRVQIALRGQDPDGDALTYAVSTGPGHGGVVVADTTANYRSVAGFTGTDTFTYTASDGRLTSAPATVTITVAAPNRAPVITAAPALRVTAGSSATLGVEATDADDDPVGIVAVSAPAQGSVRIVGALQVAYTPSTRSGTDTFEVTVSDGHGGTALARVGVDIAARTALLTLSAPPAARGALATITVAATGPEGPRPTGVVTISSAGRPLATVPLTDGVATLTTPATTAGASDLTATYAGDGLFAPTTSAPVTLTTIRSPAALTVTGRRLRRGHPGVVTVAVTTLAGVAPTGQVTIRAGRRRLTATLVGGVATFRIHRLPRTRRLTVGSAYLGDTQYAAGTAARTLRVR